MYIALDKEQKRISIRDAVQGDTFFCPVCLEKMFVKSGAERARHFSHFPNCECNDSWNGQYDMSDWHYEWQNQFPPENQEVVVQCDAIRHRADVLTDRTVVEFQHSPLSSGKYNDRNVFYHGNIGYKKAKKETIKPANVLLRNPQQPNLPTLSTPGYATSPITALLNGGFDNGLDPEIGVLLSRLKSLDDRHHKAADELDAVVSKRGKFLYMIVHRGYFTRDFVEEYFPEEIHEKLLTPLPITDPFELCFALLYLVETGSDIPWLYGSCIGMMSEVIDCLPWGLSDYSEMEDPYWEDMPPIASKIPDFPDWYQRDFAWKGDDEYDARSLAQIVYEATGCLMPRDLHRYDAMLKDLGKYGIKQNKAIAMLYCMLALSNARRRVNPNNLEADYMRVISHEEPVAETTPADWAEQKAALEKQIQQLRSALHTAEKSAEESKRKLEQQQKQAEAEHRELADLREIVFNQEDDTSSDGEAPIDSKVYPYTVQKSTVVFGGHETWVKALKPLLKGDIKFIAREMKIDVSLVRYADVIWIQSNAIPHRSYYSIVNTARKLGKPIRYFTNASAAKCAEQIVENDKRG